MTTAWRSLQRLPQRVLLGLILAYRFMLSPWLGNACRFEPSCSRYALEAIERHGALTGSYLMTRRLLRCHPWCAGGCDPVPVEPPRLFSRLISPESAVSVGPEGDAASARMDAVVPQPYPPRETKRS